MTNMVYLIKCEVITRDDLSSEKVGVRVSEYIMGEQESRDLVVGRDSLVWRDNQDEQLYLKVSNRFSSLSSNVGLIAQVNTFDGVEDLSIHPDDFVEN